MPSSITFGVTRNISSAGGCLARNGLAIAITLQSIAPAKIHAWPRCQSAYLRVTNTKCIGLSPALPHSYPRAPLLDASRRFTLSRSAPAAANLPESSHASKIRTSSIKFWAMLRERNRTPPQVLTAGTSRAVFRHLRLREYPLDDQLLSTPHLYFLYFVRPCGRSIWEHPMPRRAAELHCPVQGRSRSHGVSIIARIPYRPDALSY